MKVEPVRRYRVPKYPSHLDPNPIDHPVPIPYPHRRELFAALLGLTACTADAPPPPSNPFSIGYAGLPHRSLMFGTGAPSYVDDTLARETIERVFRREGFELEPERAGVQ